MTTVHLKSVESFAETIVIDKADMPRRKLRLGSLTALVIGSMLGSGVFSLPQNMAAGHYHRLGDHGRWHAGARFRVPVTCSSQT